MGLDSQVTKFGIVINLPNGREALPLSDVLPQLFSEWSFILHNKDFLPDGVKKTTHYHIVSKTTKRTRMATIINKLAELLKIDTLCISCRKCLSYTGAIQYLVHKNDKDKAQYPIDDIVSSINREELTLVIEADNHEITLDRLYYTIKHAHSLYDVMKEIGLSNYVGYRNVIKDLWAERDCI